MSKTLHFAFCLFNYFPFGGLQRDFLRIAQECVSRGHTVDVYTMKWEGDKEPSLNIHILSVSGMQNHTRAKQFAAEIAKETKRVNYDAIVGFNKMPGLDFYYAADTCFQAKARLKHGAWYRLTPRYRHLMNFERAVFDKNASTHILLIAAAQQAEFSHFYGTSSERVHLLPPGISKNNITSSDALIIRQEMREHFQMGADDFLVLLVGSGFKTKGLDRALEGLASLPRELKNRTRLFVIGQDHAKSFLKQAAKLRISNQVTFLGGRKDVPRFLRAADLLVHPAYNENTGTVLLEAIAAGLPVLTTDVCGYAHYIEEANAGSVLTSPFKQIEFNEAMQTMLLSPLRSAWHENGIRFAKENDLYSLAEVAVDTIIRNMK